MSKGVAKMKELPKGIRVAALLMVLALVPVIAFAISEGQTSQENIVTIRGDDDKLFRFEVELARTPQEMTKGLMGREELKEGTGMLFLFPDYASRNFWMKDTLIPLDIIFIRIDGTIGHIHPMARPLDTTQIRSYGPVKAVLEINGGVTEELGIKVGHKVYHPAFSNILAD